MSDPAPRLRLVSGLRLRHEPGAGHALESADRVHAVGPHTLAIVDAFLQPRSLPEAIRLLQARTSGRQDWIDLTAEIVQMRRSGLLLPEDADNPPAQVENAFSAVPVHIRMLRDRTRTLAYLDAIRASVRPGDVVVDLGTGTGILAATAARAGALRVYAIEASAIADVAERVFAANGVADRVRLLRGWSTQLELPERADILVSEIIGNDPMAERILECTADAVHRFLKPDARLLPSKLCLLAVPLQLPKSLAQRTRVTPDQLAEWRKLYELDLEPLADNCGDARLLLPSADSPEWTPLAPSSVLEEIDLRARSEAPRNRECVFSISEDGKLEAVAFGFEARLLDGLKVSSNPSDPRPDNHWSHPVHVLAKPLAVRRGERVALRTSSDRPAELALKILE